MATREDEIWDKIKLNEPPKKKTTSKKRVSKGRWATKVNREVKKYL